jgi:nickel superoxide dismutase
MRTFFNYDQPIKKLNRNMNHCDVPCGIYDPHNAQLAAHTIIRMTQFLGEIKRDNETKAEHDIARVTHVKEEHSNLLEDELMTLKNDYFKKDVVEKLEKEPWELFKKALASLTKARVGIDMEAAEETLETVMEIAELFYKSKGIESHRVKAPYPTGLDIVVQKE